MSFSPIPEILDDLRAGKIIVLVDDEERENEGDFVCAAQKITPELISFMTRVGGGYLCVSLTSKDCDRLNLTPQVPSNSSAWGTAMTVSVDGHTKHGVSTGVSAKDRAKTIQLLIESSTTSEDFARPGHINPLRARDGGVLVRTGQTEGSVDLARLAGLHPSAVIIEIVGENGEMARMPQLELVCKEHNLKMCSVEQVIEYRLERESLINRLSPTDGTMIETPYGQFNLIGYQSAIDPLPHIALTVGNIGKSDGNGQTTPVDEPVIVRMHRRDLLGDIFDESNNPTGRELRNSLRMIQDAGQGVLVYLRTEGVGDDLRGRLQQIQRPNGDDINTPDLTRFNCANGNNGAMNQRNIGIGGQILRDLGLKRLRILTNHPKTLPGLHGFGLEIVDQIPISNQPAELQTVS